MSEWNSAAERIAKLVERYLTPMIEDAEKARDQRKADELLASSEDDSGRSGPQFAFQRFIGVPIDRSFSDRPLFSMARDGHAAVVCESGAVFAWNGEIWIEQPAIPGTPSARPKDQSVSVTDTL